MDLSIIIVNWKSAALLRKCIQSILASAAGLELEILVIDNASFDGSAEMVSNEFPSVSFIQSNENLGFAGGNNRAFQQSTGRYVLFLNPDTEVVGDALQKMLGVFETHRDAGVVGPNLVNPDLTAQLTCMRVFPGILHELFDSNLSKKLFPMSDLWGLRPVIQAQDGPVRVEMLPGTCAMLRREVFEAAGRFSEKYFMYAEDIELSYKVKQAGWTNYYLGAALVVHHGGQSSNQKVESFFSAIMMRESVWKFLRANRGLVYAATYRITTLLAALARVSVLGMVWLLPVNSRAKFRAAQAARKWVKVGRWCLGMESWARDYHPAVIPRAETLAVSVQAQ
jgi:hypothetical protein